MTGFADRLVAAVRHRGNPLVAGLDPRVDAMPAFVTGPLAGLPTPDAARRAITRFHEVVIEEVAPLVPAVKPQVAFFERHGPAGVQALADTIAAARAAGVLVVVDAKRGDVPSTAEAYAAALLDPASALAGDACTVSPYLGRDSLVPFVDACAEHGTGIFVLVKTSNPGSGDVQDLAVGDGTVAARVAAMVDELGAGLVGTCGYSAVGAVVGATWPGEAAALRALMPRATVLVPGYGAQGGTGATAAASFHPGGLGALVSASRSLTYDVDPAVSEADFRTGLRERVAAMAADVRSALGQPAPAAP